MTVQNTIAKNVYAGNGSTTVWPYTFALSPEDGGHVQVIVADALDVETMVPANEFRVDTDDQTVTYPLTGDPLPAGHRIALKRVLPKVQELNLENQGPFFADDIETSLDRIVMLIQQISEETERAVKVGETSPETADQLLQHIYDRVGVAEEAAAGAAESAANAKESETAVKQAEQNAVESANSASTSAANSANSASEAAQTVNSAIDTITGKVLGSIANNLARNKAYAVGDIAYSNGLPSWARLECVTAGTTGDTEPDFGTASTGGVLLYDGSVLWIIDDARDCTPVGAVTGRLYLPPGYIKANGATVQRADYPRLVALADKYNLWTDTPATYAGLFGKGDGSTTMALPNLVGRMAQFADTAGGTVAAGLPNIMGNLTAGQGQQTAAGGNGAFSATSTGACSAPRGYQYDGVTVMNFDASKSNTIYGASTTVQPPAINVLAVIRY